ncbi:hypothetical protein RJ639_044743 [Escallonia herrerae]|uniref:F-box domain-containing protein n=1 Tax=Escallonia herrerae TaxID=1293975 RepID=A0AA89B079_9ASTE|nr:hypothetical protein RJ639_044743 [Escallonia herrerae]
MEPPNSAARPPWKKRSTEASTTISTITTTIQALSPDILYIIFSFVDIFDLVRLSAVCKSWSVGLGVEADAVGLRGGVGGGGGGSGNGGTVEVVEEGGGGDDAFFGKVPSRGDFINREERSLKMHLEELAMDRHQFGLQEDLRPRPKFSQSLMRSKDAMAVDLKEDDGGGGGRRRPLHAMRLWSVESYKCLDEFSLPDRAPLVDFDFDESKVVGLVGTRICIWRRDVRRQVFSSSEGRFMKASCMRYLDPNAVVGCEDGRARVFDMYLKKWSQIINGEEKRVEMRERTATHPGLFMRNIAGDKWNKKASER